MARIDLGVVLDRQAGSFEPGEPIGGNVVAHANGYGRSRRVSVSLGVLARGKRPVEFAADRVAMVEQVVVAENVEWQAGEERRLSFRLLPNGVVRSYAGHLMHMQPFVQASTAVTSSEPLPVEIRPLPDRGLHVAWSDEDLAPQTNRWVPYAAGLLLASATAAVWSAAQVIPWAIVVSVFVLAGAAIAFGVGIRPWLSQLKTGPVGIAFEPLEGSGAPGDVGVRMLRVTLRVRPTTPLAGPPKATLVVREWVRRVTSDARPVWTHPLFGDAAELHPIGEPGHFSGNVRLPQSGSLPYPFLAGDAESGSVGASAFAVRWEIEVSIPVQGGVDCRRTVPLRARPIHVPFR